MEKSKEKSTTGDWLRQVDGTYLPQWRLEIKMAVVADMTSVKSRGESDV